MKYTKIVIRDSHRIEATKWARSQFGMPKGENKDLQWNELVWYSQQIKAGAGFYFSNPDHAAWFSLRWS